MKFKEYDISERLGNTKVTELTFNEGLIDIAGFLFFDLKEQLIKESRFKGIMIKYDETIKSLYLNIQRDVTENDIDAFGKQLYMFKLVLKSEQSRLIKKRLSPADSIICLIRKLFIIAKEGIPSDYKNLDNINKISGIVEKVWENIRNRSKNDSMFSLSNLIRNCRIKKIVGKYPLDVFTISRKERVVEVLKGDGTKLSSESKEKVKEINL